MKRPHRSAAIAMAFACYLSSMLAYAQEARSVYQRTDPAPQSIASDFDELSFEQEPFHTPVDLSTNSTSSTLPHTNWQFDTEFLLYDLDYGLVDFQNTEGGKELGSGLRFSFSKEIENGYGIRASASITKAEGQSNEFYPVDIAINGNLLPRNDPPPAGSIVSPFRFVRHSAEFLAGTSNIDAYKSLDYEQGNILFGVGLSGAGFNMEVPSVTRELSLLAGGVSLFSEGEHLLYHNELSELSVIGSGRIGILSGERDSTFSTGSSQGSTHLSITEVAAGLQWKRKLGNSILNLRAQYEYQLWNTDGMGELVLNGAALRAGISW